MPNVNQMDFKQTWDTIYQITHYKLPAYKAIADESIEPKLQEGQQFHRTYSSDIPSDDMGGNGEYNTTPITDNDEYIIVNKVKQASFTLKKLDQIQAHLPVRVKYAQKSMNSLFTQIDADVFVAAYQGAGSVVDNGALGGTAGTSIVPTVGNVQQIFGAAEVQLRLNNVIYDPAATFSGKFTVDKKKVMPVAVISAQLYNTLLLYLGGKTSALGDEVSRNGFIGKFFGFNCFVSNGLPWSSQIQIPTNPTDGDVFKLLYNVSTVAGGVATPQVITFTFKGTLGTTAGNVKICSTAAKTATNLAAALSAPFTAIAETADTGFAPFVKQNVGLGNSTTGSVTTMQQRLLGNMTATQVDATGAASITGTNVNVVIGGLGNVPVTYTFTSGNNSIPATSQTQHNIFAVNNSISLVIQRTPMFEILQSLPTSTSLYSGRVAKDFVTWVPYGRQVFTDQAPQLIDVQINTAAYTTAPVAQNY